jgi:hypothetical protein
MVYIKDIDTDEELYRARADGTEVTLQFVHETTVFVRVRNGAESIRTYEYQGPAQIDVANEARVVRMRDI